MTMQLLAVCSDIGLGLIAYGLTRQLGKVVSQLGIVVAQQADILRELTNRVERLERATTQRGV